MLLILAVWVKRYLKSLTLGCDNPLSLPALRAPVPDPPKVSVILAARNEERVIEQCLRSLTRQSYENYEVIVADDRSTDATGKIIAEKFPSVKQVKIPSLPNGWAGKSHALWCARQEARGDWLLFTDADTVHSPLSLRVPLTFARNNGVEMLMLLSRPVIVTFWEKILQPVACIMLFILFPLERINRQESRLAFGNGQYILISRRAYDLIGGHERLRDFPLEDIAMAQNAKRAGVNFRLLHGGEFVQCRMYSSLDELWKGWERIYFLIFSDYIWILPPLISVIAVLSLFPYAGLFLDPPLALLSLLFLHLASERTYRFIHADRRYIFFHPVGCALLMGILWSAFWKKVRGKGVLWKGKRYYGQNFLAR